MNTFGNARPTTSPSPRDPTDPARGTLGHGNETSPAPQGLREGNDPGPVTTNTNVHIKTPPVQPLQTQAWGVPFPGADRPKKGTDRCPRSTALLPCPWSLHRTHPTNIRTPPPRPTGGISPLFPVLNCFLPTLAWCPPVGQRMGVQIPTWRAPPSSRGPPASLRSRNRTLQKKQQKHPLFNGSL